MSKVDSRTAPVAKMSREQFELRLVNIESCYGIAFESAKTMDILSCNARDLAKQRRMNIMVETMICQLEEETAITIETIRNERPGQVPFPLKINHEQTMLNWDNNR